MQLSISKGDSVNVAIQSKFFDKRIWTCGCWMLLLKLFLMWRTDFIHPLKSTYSQVIVQDFLHLLLYPDLNSCVKTLRYFKVWLKCSFGPTSHSYNFQNVSTFISNAKKQMRNSLQNGWQIQWQKAMTETKSMKRKACDSLYHSAAPETQRWAVCVSSANPGGKPNKLNSSAKIII